MDMERSEVLVQYNVGIRVVDTKTGRISETFGNNRVMKNFLIGLLKFIKGDFSVSLGDMTQFIPYYLKAGSGNTPVTVTDPGLDDPIIVDGKIFKTPIQESQPDYSGQDFVTLSYRFQIDTNALVGETISEIGLFTKAENDADSYMLARYVLDEPIIKTNTEFIQVVWVINFRSYHPEPTPDPDDED